MKLTEVARFVDDVPRSVEFYRTLLGVEPSYAEANMATFQCDGVTILIHRRYTPGPGDLPCEDHIAFSVPSVDEAVAILVKRGMTIQFPPKDYDWGRSAYLRDPQSSLVEIAQLENEHSE